MNLQELVTESTFQSQGETTILEIFRSPARLSPEDCLLAIESYRAGLDIIARDKVVAETTRALLALRGLEKPFHTVFFLYALDYQEEGNAESLDFLRKGADEWISRMKKPAREELVETLVGNRERGLLIISEKFGEVICRTCLFALPAKASLRLGDGFAEEEQARFPMLKFVPGRGSFIYYVKRGVGTRIRLSPGQRHAFQMNIFQFQIDILRSKCSGRCFFISAHPELLKIIFLNFCPRKTHHR